MTGYTTGNTYRQWEEESWERGESFLPSCIDLSLLEWPLLQLHNLFLYITSTKISSTQKPCNICNWLSDFTASSGEGPVCQFCLLRENVKGLRQAKRQEETITAGNNSSDHPSYFYLFFIFCIGLFFVSQMFARYSNWCWLVTCFDCVILFISGITLQSLGVFKLVFTPDKQADWLKLGLQHSADLGLLLHSASNFWIMSPLDLWELICCYSLSLTSTSIK